MKKSYNMLLLPASKRSVFSCLALLALSFAFNSGCKKDDANPDKEFGEGKLTVQCAGQCIVRYSVADNVNNAIVNKTQGEYRIKYQRNYALAIDVTPADVDQNIVVNVYSREGKQIYHNEANKSVNSIWSAKVLIP
ncbi:hypothetical protein FPZ43_00075 [Mucilaginibacter pallidiroseus]|uniref:Uncharacterized protein n=1 Tax=Mucilaginibacter pallidiroseus TaxID=2599295 RepID=A0A563UHT0_9SPHI|nr:hypothetical protein [Mucilaginibacter pallidiroseus]TWR30915.1 hypothetical protein FPZ43_00075 [Mucilaginibacter pallidiroseus]